MFECHRTEFFSKEYFNFLGCVAYSILYPLECCSCLVGHTLYNGFVMFIFKLLMVNIVRMGWFPTIKTLTDFLAKKI